MTHRKRRVVHRSTVARGGAADSLANMRKSRVFGCVLFLGCGSENAQLPSGAGVAGTDNTAGVGGSAGTGEAGGEASGVRSRGAWQPCALVPGEDTTRAECLEVVLPLDHTDPASRDFPVLVKRNPASGTETRQLWLLHGGPTSSAVDDLHAMSRAWHGMPGLGIYAVDHRGIGGAARLGCSAESPSSEAGPEIAESEWSQCLDEVRGRDDLEHLTTTASARDLGVLIDELAGEDVAVFLYGGSYGTYLAHRYLQLQPEQPTGIIMEGIVSPHEPHFVGYDADMNRAGRALFEVCASDPACRAHFAEHPFDVATRVVRSLDEGHCPALGATSQDVRSVFGSLAFLEPFNTSIPGLVTRVERCNDDDLAMLSQYMETVAPLLGTSRAIDATRANRGDGSSSLIFWHVTLPELYATGTRPSVLAQELESYTVVTGLELELAQRAASWPVLPRDELYGRWADYTGPLLMLQGGLDPTTTVERARPVGQHFDGVHQHWVEFPHDVHDLVDQTPTLDGHDCATTIMRAFVEDPHAELDRSCIERLAPIDFDGDPESNRYLFGRSTPWAE